MLYLISYDISNDKLRTRVSHYLEEKGTRVQASVFECRLPRQRAMKVARELTKILKGAKKADIRIYQICANCRKLAMGVGDIVHAPEKKDYYIV